MFITNHELQIAAPLAIALAHIRVAHVPACRRLSSSVLILIWASTLRRPLIVIAVHLIFGQQIFNYN